MTNKNIHPAAIIEPGAQIGANVTIEPYVIVKGNVILEDNVTLKSHCLYRRLYDNRGRNYHLPRSQHRDKNTRPQIPRRKNIRQNRQKVRNPRICHHQFLLQGKLHCQVGDKCLIMAYCHIAHNCELGNRVIMSNNATLAGHVIVEDCAIIGGMTPIHQFIRIGCYAMVGGMSRVTHDIPPYTIGAGIPFRFGGLNLVGLKRNGFPLATRQALTKAFKLLYRSGLRIEEALDRIENEVPDIPEVRHWIQFCRGSSKRGLLGLQGISKRGKRNACEEDSEEEEFSTASTSI